MKCFFGSIGRSSCAAVYGNPSAAPFGQTMRIQEGIEAERKILAGVRAQADVIIDTTAMKPADLQEYMGSRFGAVDKKRDMQITVFSFGFKYGIPIDADMVIDVRFLPNPFYVEEYKHWTGRVPEVAAYIEKSPVTKEFKRKLFNFMGFIVDQFRDRGKRSLPLLSAVPAVCTVPFS